MEEIIRIKQLGEGKIAWVWVHPLPSGYTAVSGDCEVCGQCPCPHLEPILAPWVTFEEGDHGKET